MVKKLSTIVGAISTATLTLVIITVIFNAYAELVPEAQQASDEAATNIGVLGGLFIGGVFFGILIMSSLVITILRNILFSNK